MRGEGCRGAVFKPLLREEGVTNCGFQSGTRRHTFLTQQYSLKHILDFRLIPHQAIITQTNLRQCPVRSSPRKNWAISALVLRVTMLSLPNPELAARRGCRTPGDRCMRPHAAMTTPTMTAKSFLDLDVALGSGETRLDGLHCRCSFACSVLSGGEVWGHECRGTHG